METTVEFSVQGTLCRVVPEDRVADSTACAQSGNGGWAPDGRIVGDCLLDGRRYLIVCDGNGNGHPPEPVARIADLLTGRELQVAMLVSQGLGNKQIAHRLGLSEWTVTSYLRRCFAKLGVRTRAAMVARIVSNLRP
jgi:DNA-binding NarL/FixJ family response regulator